MDVVAQCVHQRLVLLGVLSEDTQDAIDGLLHHVAILGANDVGQHGDRSLGRGLDLEKKRALPYRSHGLAPEDPIDPVACVLLELLEDLLEVALVGGRDLCVDLATDALARPLLRLLLLVLVRVALRLYGRSVAIGSWRRQVHL